MYETILAKIATTLGTITKVKDSFSIPKTGLTEFPCVFYKPLGFTNEFATTTENYKVYRFLMIVMVGASNQTVANAFGVILPKVVDDIIAAFDGAWNQGTIEGHRVTAKVDSADAWEVSEEQTGLIAYAPLTLEVRVLTNT